MATPPAVSEPVPESAPTPWRPWRTAPFVLPLVVGAFGVAAVAWVAWTGTSVHDGTPVGLMIALSVVSVVAAFGTAVALRSSDGWDAAVCLIVGGACVAVYFTVPPAALRREVRAIEPAVTALAQALDTETDLGCHPPTVDVSALAPLVAVDVVCVRRGPDPAVLFYDDRRESGIVYSEGDAAVYVGRSGCALRVTDRLWIMRSNRGETDCPVGDGTLVLHPS